jgi:hypothetical protein
VLVETLVNAKVETFSSASAAELLNCEEYGILRTTFSTGVTLAELRSIAILLVSFAQVTPPPRQAKRSLPALIAWYRSQWPAILPWLPSMGLRDERDLAINGRRELMEKGIKVLW